MLKGGAPLKSQRYGIRIKKIGNYWIKEVNPAASPMAQSYAQRGLQAQVAAFKRLREDAPSFLFANGRLITRDVGQFSGSIVEMLRIQLKGSWRLGTPANDIYVRRNIGATGQIIDPVYNPYYTVPLWGLAYGVGLSIERSFMNTQIQLQDVQSK